MSDSETDTEEEKEEELHHAAAWLIGVETIRRIVVNTLKIPVTDDSRIYQVNCRYFVAVLVVFAIGITTRHVVGVTIKCWCPAELRRFQVEYVDSYCWVSNTYYVPFKGPIPQDPLDREQEELPYYQWVPIILIFQAFLFYLPRWIWKNVCPRSGINIKKLIGMADQALYSTPDDQSDIIWNLASYMDKWIEFRDFNSSRGIILKKKLNNAGINRGNFLTALFFFIGILYSAISILQFYFLDVVLKSDFRTLGIDFISSMLKHEERQSMARFPRVTFCDLLIRQMANVQRWTVQCSLPINLFNEKIFLIIWFMLVVGCAVNTSYMLCNVYSFFISTWRYDHIKKYLMLNNPENFRENEQSKKFVEKYLKSDGVLVLWLLGHNSSDIIVMDLIQELWTKYQRKLKR